MRPIPTLGSPAQAGAILVVLQRNPDGLTRNEISKLTKIPIQSVCARVGELLDEGRIMRGPDRDDAVTHFMNETLLPRPSSTRQLDLGTFGGSTA